MESEKYVRNEHTFSNGYTVYNNFGKSITGKVFSYGTHRPAEFYAEYICGRINGIKYPESTNQASLSTSNYPKLNFID